MKLLYISLCMLILPHSTLMYGVQKGDSLGFEEHVQEDTQTTKMGLLIGVIGNNSALQNVAEILSEDFSRASQKKTGFNVTVRSFKKRPSKSQIYKIFIYEGYPFIVFLHAPTASSFEWRLHDALQVVMLKSDRVTYTHTKLDSAVHSCADHILKELKGSM